MTFTARRAALLTPALLALAIALPMTAGAQTPPNRYADSSRCAQGSAFFVENRSEIPIAEIYVRVTGATGWGEDRLGERVLGRGERLDLDPGQQIVDVLMLTYDGRAQLAPRQNACVISWIRVNPARTLEIR